MSAGADLLGVTEETFNMVKAQTNGLTSATGIYGVNLGALVSLVPVVTPFRNKTGRRKPPQGSKVAYWRSLLNVNNAQPNPAVGFDYGPSALTVLSEQDVYSPFAPLREVVRITEDAIDVAEGYENAVAVATVQAINQLMIGEDRFGIGGLAFALPTISTPTLTTATTGGSIAATTAIYVKVAARSGWNYYYGGSQAVSAYGTVTTGAGSTNTATASVTAVKGAVAYDWFAAATSGGTYYYVTTTTVNTNTFTTIPVANNTTVPSLPDLSSVLPTSAPASDGSYSANNFNGLLASILGDYGSTSLVTTGTGTSSGAYFASLDGGSLTWTGAGISQLDAMNLSIWNTAKVSPSRYMVNAAQSQEVANLIMGSTAATTFLQSHDAASRTGIVAGGSWGSYLNKACEGRPINVEIHPHIPPGTVIAVCDEINYPGANITVPYEFEVQRDYSRFDYGANWVANTSGGGPRQDIGFNVQECFKLYAPVTCGVLSNVA